MVDNIDDPLNIKKVEQQSLNEEDKIQKQLKAFENSLRNKSNIKRKQDLKEIKNIIFKSSVGKFIFLFSLIALPLILSIYPELKDYPILKEKFLANLLYISVGGFIVAMAGSILWARTKYKHDEEEYDRMKE